MILRLPGLYLQKIVKIEATFANTMQRQGLGRSADYFSKVWSCTFIFL